jgi:hypothetical protein
LCHREALPVEVLVPKGDYRTVVPRNLPFSQ